MPITPINYSKTIIYKIEHIENEDLVYVGHTTCWDKRKCQHKINCNNERMKEFNNKLYKMMRNNGGWDMFKMIEVEKYPCNDKREAEKRENEVMKELKATMNTIQSYTTKEQKQKSSKQYYKVYKELNKIDLQAKKKKYREENRISLNEKLKDYYKINKHSVLEKCKEKIECECGCEITKTFLKKHQATKKHIDLIKNKI